MADLGDIVYELPLVHRGEVVGKATVTRHPDGSIELTGKLDQPVPGLGLSLGADDVSIYEEDL